MNGWCLLLLVCVGVTVVQGQSPNSLIAFIMQKRSEFFKMADINGDGTLTLTDNHLSSQFVVTVPGYTKYNVSDLYDLLTANSVAAFPGQDVTLQQFNKKLSTTDPISLKTDVYGWAKTMYDVYDFLPPSGCLNAVEIGWELQGFGKAIDVPLQAQLALNAMTKIRFGICATLGQYQETAFAYFTVLDRKDSSKFFFGFFGEK